MSKSILCLAPTYGRRQGLLNNMLACFASQTHADKTLLIYDDLGTLNQTTCDVPNVHIMSTPHRSQSIGRKYNVMVDFAIVMGIDFDAVAVLDDDDRYFCSWLKHHAETLKSHRWSKPSSIWSAYHNPPALENASGRFHGSIAVSRELLVEVNGWIETQRATFDQEFLQLLSSKCPPGDTLNAGPASYCYRWQTSQAGHCSGLMGDSDWYQKYQPDSREPIDRLWPEFDADSIRIAKHCGVALP